MGANPNATNTKTLMTCIHWVSYYTSDKGSLECLEKYVGLDNMFLLDGMKMTPLDVAGINGKNEECFDTLAYLIKCAERYFYNCQLDPQPSNSVKPVNSNDKYIVIKQKLD